MGVTLGLLTHWDSLLIGGRPLPLQPLTHPPTSPHRDGPESLLSAISFSLQKLLASSHVIPPIRRLSPSSPVSSRSRYPTLRLCPPGVVLLASLPPRHYHQSTLSLTLVNYYERGASKGEREPFALEICSQPSVIWHCTCEAHERAQDVAKNGQMGP